MKKIYYALVLCSATSTTFANSNYNSNFFNGIHQSISHSMKEFEDAMNRFAGYAANTGHQLRNQAANVLSTGITIYTNEDRSKGVFRIEASVPGFKKGEVKAKLERFGNGQTKLTISAESKQEEETITKSAQGTTRSSHFGFSKAEQSMMLPLSVDSSSHKAHHEDGVFSLEFPLKKEATADVVEITVGDEAAPAA